MKLNAAVALKVLKAVDAGLVKGVGVQIPGKMCVEAAVCYALGLPHGDNPPCVGSAVRAFKIKLNDMPWSSKQARAKGMRRVAIAQLGSNEIDQQEFRKHLAVGTIKKILPVALRAAGALIPAHKDALEVAALACEAVVAFAGARAVALQAKKAAYAAAYAADAAAYAYAAYAADAADAAYAYAADAAADAAAYAYAYADAKTKARDKVYMLAAEVCVDALKKCKSQGVKWLKLAA